MFSVFDSLVCGNLPEMNWVSPELAAGVDEVQFSKLFTNTAEYIPNKGSQPSRSCYHQCFWSSREYISAMLNPAESGLITDHSVITFNFQTVTAVLKLKRTVFDYSEGNFNDLMDRTAGN